ncbi:MAG: hypothetical protein COA83_09910 [Methylophaga sp.]|nr:MAG: hypothetical protein COA83_09910 [Methylophaga sp.]
MSAVSVSTTKLQADITAALAAAIAAGLGVGQTWQNMIASRALNTIYTNTSSKPIFIAITFSSGPFDSAIIVSGVAIMHQSTTTTDSRQSSFVVPSGSSYSISTLGTTLYKWAELR